jgi:hypothetical protein
MKKFSVVSDLNAPFYFSNLNGAFSDLTDEIALHHPNFPFDIGICIRCMIRAKPRRTFCRFDKKDNCLGMDIAFITEDVEAMIKCEQRHLFGHTVFNYVNESILKYAKPSAERDALIEDLRSRMAEKEWLLDEVDYANPLDVDD